MDKARLTDAAWRNFDPWECCGQHHKCTSNCECCIVPQIYVRLAQYEDAELARQVPDWQHKYRLKEVEREGTQNALDDARLTIKELRRELENVQNCVSQRPGEVYERVSEMACETPKEKRGLPDEIAAAIDFQETILKSQNEWLEEFNKMDKSNKVDTAIKEQQEHIRKSKTILAALRQYRKPEPCEWCEKTLVLFTHSGKYIPENQPPRIYCGACGRPLGGD